MSDATATALKLYAGTLIAIGDTGIYDEWLQPRSKPALSDVPTLQVDKVSQKVVELANTGFLTTTLPESVQIGVRRSPNGYTLVLVNTGKQPTTAGVIELRFGTRIPAMTAHLSTLDGKEIDVPFLATPPKLQLSIPAGIDTVALLTLSLAKEPSGQNQQWLPLATN
jgi:hypothetical protein